MPAWITPLEWEVWWAASAFLALEHAERGVRVPGEQLASDGQADDARANDDEVACGRRLAHSAETMA